MKVTHNVKSSQKNIPAVEVGVDTVYKRYNIAPYVDGDFEGFNIGTEIQYPLRKYIEKLLDTETGQLIIAENTAETLEVVSFLNEQQKIEQAQSNAELIELVMMLGGM